jgi:hypothetical protein
MLINDPLHSIANYLARTTKDAVTSSWNAAPQCYKCAIA